MIKWGNIRATDALIDKIKNTIKNNLDFRNVSDFTEYHLRQALEKLEASQK